MTTKENMKNGNVSPFKILSIQNLITLAAVIIVLVGMLYLFDAAEQSRKIAIESREAATARTDNVLKELNSTANAAVTQHTNIVADVAELVNDIKPLINNSNTLLTQRTALINHIENNTDKILDTLDTRKHEHQNQTELIIKGLLQTGNATAQRGAIKVIYENQKALEELQNTIDELTELLKGNPYIY